MKILILNHSEVERLLPVRECIPVMGGALVWQRLRPQALGDLRETPAGVR